MRVNQMIDEIRSRDTVEVKKQKLAGILAVVMMRLMTVQQHDIIGFCCVRFALVFQIQLTIYDIEKDGRSIPLAFDAVMLIAKKIAAAHHIEIKLLEYIRCMEKTHIGSLANPFFFPDQKRHLPSSIDYITIPFKRTQGRSV